MARVVKVPTATPPFGKTPLKHGAKVEIVSLGSSKAVLMEPTGALRANAANNYNCGDKFVVSQLGSAVMLQCPLTGHIIGANAGYLYGYRASEQQAALRVYYHEDSGAIEFEACADPGKFLAFDRVGNIIPLNGNSTPLQRMFAVRVVEKVAKQEAPKSSLSGMLNMGMKAVTKAVGEGEVQLNFERNNLRGALLNRARVRLRSTVTGKYLAIMANGIVHGNGDPSDELIVHHCFGVMRYAFQSAKYPNLWLCVTLDNITWAMVNHTMKQGKTENPSMVWEVDKCKSDGRILLRRNTQISNGIIHQFLGFAPTGKPTPTLIHPEEMGEIIVEKTSAPLHAVNNAPVTLHAQINAPAPIPGAPSAPPGYSAGPPRPPPIGAAAGAVHVNYNSAPPPPPPMDTSPGGLYAIPPGALLYEGSVVVMKNNIGYMCSSGGQLETSPAVTQDCGWKVTSTGFMMFSFENAKNGGFMKATDSNVVIGPPGNDTMFEVKFNPNGSVSFQSTVSNMFIGIKDPEMYLEMAS
ncbi:uncharacterized protein LOC134812190 [Bolinopsis microptera]|uniref:uncharacterized protein LOC134812190 n=1 Tax=Bolinopsis microptera TaxID=2820187 RepID=UPI0030792982